MPARAAKRWRRSAPPACSPADRRSGHRTFPGGPFGQGGHGAGPAGADDQIAFPVSGHRPVVGLGGTFGDVDHPRRSSSPTAGCGPAGVAGPARTQARCQFFAQLTFGLHEDRLIDRLVRHPPLWLVGMITTQPLSDLLGRPPLRRSRACTSTHNHGRVLDPRPLRAARRLVGLILSAVGPIPGPATMSGDLPPDRGAMPTQPAGDHRVGLTTLDTDTDLLAFVEPQRIGTR